MTGSDDIKINGAPEQVDIPIEPVSGEATVEYVNLDAHPFSMAKVLKPGRVGRFAIEASTISKGTIVGGYQRYKGKKTIIEYNFDCPLIKLTEDGNPWMTDNLFEVESTVGAVEVARGDVLVGGLGMGLFPTWIKDKVNSIDIVELNQEVIDLVFHQVATEKMKIIHDEIYHYLRTTDKQYDFIFIDIWQDTLSPFWEIDGARKLAQRCLKLGGTTWCWMQEQYDSLQWHKL
jgi:hypothetical protein